MNDKKTFFYTLPGIMTGIIAAAGFCLCFFIFISCNEKRTKQGENELSGHSQQEDPVEKAKKARLMFIKSVTGKWKVTEKKPVGITKLEIQPYKNFTIVHAWGICDNSECDWHETYGFIDRNIVFAQWLWDGEETNLSVHPIEDGLHCEVIHINHENGEEEVSEHTLIKIPE